MVYIASKYIENKEINRRIYEELSRNGIDVFLPESINIDAISVEEMLMVAEECYNALEKSDIVIFVSPYGDSVVSEVAYSLFQKRHNMSKTIILFGKKHKSEAMIDPYIDYIVDEEERRTDRDYQELINKIKTIYTN